MNPLAVGPLLALVGIVAAFFVLRGKAKTRKSMYRTLRERREIDLRKARARATAAKGSAERAAMEREAAAQAATAGPAAAAVIQPPQAAPVYAPPPPATPPEPAYTPQQPTYSPPEPLPAPPPVEEARVAPLTEPPPTADDQTKPSWEIVQPDRADAETVGAGAAADAASGKASWELDPRERQGIDDRHKGRGRQEEDEEEEDDAGQESLAQVLISYAGLVVALLVILLGILFMIGGRH